MHLLLLYHALVACLGMLTQPSILTLQKVKDSWRVVNHRDIIPTVPRLMGYCHVAQPVYLAAGDLRDAMVRSLFGLLPGPFFPFSKFNIYTFL